MLNHKPGRCVANHDCTMLPYKVKVKSPAMLTKSHWLIETSRTTQSCDVKKRLCFQNSLLRPFLNLMLEGLMSVSLSVASFCSQELTELKQNLASHLRGTHHSIQTERDSCKYCIGLVQAIECNVKLNQP